MGIHRLLQGVGSMRAKLLRVPGIHTYLPIAALVGIACQLLYSLDGASGTILRTFSASTMLSIAAAAAGGFVGFLFGVPRYIAAPENAQTTAAGVRFNNNFQQISDWITKILVGISLVELRPIVRNSNQLVQWMSSALSVPETYAASIVIIYVVCGFMVAYVWTVSDYARREAEYLDRNYRISKQTLAAEAESALSNSASSLEDKKFWGERLTKAVKDNALDWRLARVKAFYDCEVYSQLGEAIKTIHEYLSRKAMAGELDDEYADGFFYLACYKRRVVDGGQATTTPKDYAEVISALREAIAIRPEIRRWVDSDVEFQKLKANADFVGKLDAAD
jgi:hypothetical protein